MATDRSAADGTGRSAADDTDRSAADDTDKSTRAEGAALLAALLVAFLLLATLNSGGYRYGASDQAFYIPAIERHLDPTLFPRDRGLIDSQSRLFFLDEGLAWASRTFGLGLPTLFAGGYVLSLALLCTALIGLGRAYLSTSWGVAAFVLAATLRHRIAKTGANTLEGYFHPRLLAFAIGLLAINAVLRGRIALAIALVGLGGLVHPTTGVWFALWAGVAILVNEPRARPAMLLLGGVGLVGGLAFLWQGPLGFATLDAAWEATLADKDYVFPTAWTIGTWVVNLLAPAVIAGAFALRVRRQVTLPREAGVVFGCLALVVVFVASLPFIAARVAVAVQLQVSRVFWMADVLATLYLVWWICEGLSVSPARVRSPLRARVVALVLLAAASVRGWYVLRVEHPGRPFAQAALPADAWTDASAWLRATPAHSHVLADPGHAWRYGTSLRVSAARDVFLEDVKDGSIGMYDRNIALRVAERRAAIGDFAEATPERLRDLAARYDLDYLVSERPLPLTEVYRNDRFRIYRLKP
jgi:hypothetical protein